jgi:hypothetical protein
MNRTDRKIMFTALAFFAVAVKGGKNADMPNDGDRVRELALAVESFCDENVINVVSPVSDETGTLLIDQLIEKHKSELRDDEVTRLPEDRLTLVKMADRLEHRHIRKKRREFYGSATEDDIADRVLELLDRELEDQGGARLT